MKINALRNLFKPGMRERIRHFIGSSNLTVFNLPKSTAQNATTLLVIPISGNLQKLLELLTAINQRKISGWHCIAVDCGNCDATQITLDDHSAIGYVRVDYGLSFGAAILAAHEQHNRGVKTIIAIDLSACTGPQIELVLAEVLNYAGSRIRSKLRKQHSAVIQLDPIDLHFKDFGLLQDIKAVNTHLNRVKGELS